MLTHTHEYYDFGYIDAVQMSKQKVTKQKCNKRNENLIKHLKALDQYLYPQHHIETFFIFW